MGALLGAIGLIVRCRCWCVTMVLIRHILYREIYGEAGSAEPAVLRPTEPWTGVERRQVAGSANDAAAASFSHHRRRRFRPLTSKTANSCIRYFPERIVAIFDRKQAGRRRRTCSGSAARFPWSAISSAASRRAKARPPS